MEASKKINRDLKLQKAIVIGLFAMMIIVFVYSLIFMTPFFDLYKIDGTFSKSNLANWGIDITTLPEACYISKNGKPFGVNMAYFTSFIRDGGLQTFNHFMFNYGFIGILISALLFVFRTQKRKRLYFTNFIVFACVAGFEIFISIYILRRLIIWHNYVGTLNYEVLNAYKSDQNLVTELVEYFKASNFDWIFNTGYIICILIFVVVALGIAFMIYKLIDQKKHKAIDISGVVINE